MLPLLVGVLTGCGGTSRPDDAHITTYVVLADEKIMTEPFNWWLVRDRVGIYSGSKEHTLDFSIHAAQDVMLDGEDLGMVRSFFDHMDAESAGKKLTREEAREEVDTRQAVLCRYALVGIENGVRRYFHGVPAGKEGEAAEVTPDRELEEQKFMRLSGRVPYLVVSRKATALDRKAFRNSDEFFQLFGVNPDWLDKESYDLDW
jgi:hypothetical protein